MTRRLPFPSQLAGQEWRRAGLWVILLAMAAVINIGLYRRP